MLKHESETVNILNKHNVMYNENIQYDRTPPCLSYVLLLLGSYQRQK
jgi:hypothetical protein